MLPAANLFIYVQETSALMFDFYFIDFYYSMSDL